MTDKPQMQMTITREWIEDDNPAPPPAPAQKNDGSAGVIVGLVAVVAILILFLGMALSQPSRGSALPNQQLQPAPAQLPRQDLKPAQPYQPSSASPYLQLPPSQPSPLVGP